jgi:superfamily II DNA or RNA helicase
MDLRPYQQKAVEESLSAWKTFDRLLGVAATGAGKTVIASHLFRKRLPLGPALFIAHRKELLSQAVDKIYRVNEDAHFGFTVGLEQADNKASAQDDVVVASVQSLHTARLQRWDPNHFKTIVIDECHRSTSKSYKQILDHFVDCKTLGITATPDRTDQRSLAEVFEHIAFEIGLVGLINDEWLSPIRVEQIPLKIDVSEVGLDSQGDLDAAELEHVLEPYLGALAQEIAARPERKTLVFLPLVKLSQTFADICKELGVAAEHIDGSFADTERKQVLTRFHDAQTRVLSCAMLLAEGYDEPSVDCICVFRPTQSRSLFAQCIGRGTRISPGKENLLILDPLWLSSEHSLIKPASLIAKDEAEVEAITNLLAGEPDLLVAQRKNDQINLELVRQRAAALAERAAAMAKRQRQFYDPLEFASVLADPELADFHGIVSWHFESVSAKQAALLQHFGINVDAVQNRGHASKLLDKLLGRQRNDLATFKQLRWLVKYDYPNAEKATFKEASAFLDRKWGKRDKQMSFV